MAKIKTPPGSVRAARGFFNASRWFHSALLKPFGLAPPFIGNIFHFPLRINTIAMAADGFNIIHTTILDRRFIGKFASLLVMPDFTGTAARHDPRHAIIRPDQSKIGFILVQ